MKVSSIFLCTALLLGNTLVQAKTLVSGEQRPIMLELYTSQGCSSCPPAEKWINKLTNDPRLWKSLIPINFHVDYWDYLGWPDPFANNAFSKRQRLYKQLGHTEYVATPGFVVDGQGWNGWFSRHAIPKKQQTSPGKLTVNLADDDSAEIAYMSTKSADKPLSVTIAILGFDQNTVIKRGENRGHVLKHDFVVLKHITKKVHSKNFTYKTKLTLPDTSEFDSSKRAVVVWISDNINPSPIQVVADWL